MISKQSSKRRILPPDVDEQVTFGIMWIRVGKLKLTRAKIQPQNKVIVQFWGQKQPLFLETKSSPLNKEESATMIQYDIKCPVTYFHEYLIDMKRNLRLQVQDLGKIDFDITKFLKPHVDLSSRYVFDHFKGAFEILGKHNRKIGSIELQMACNFNPELAALELDQQNQDYKEIQQPEQDDEMQKIKSDIDEKMAVDILAVENPQLLKQFYEDTIKQDNRQSQNKYQELKDDRIPNSLCTQMPTQKFNPDNYLNQIARDSPKKIVTKNVAQYAQQIAKHTIKSSNENDEQVSHFPTIAKVLTYSNLRLGKTIEQQRQMNEMNNVPRNNISGVIIEKNNQLSSYEGKYSPKHIQQNFNKNNKKSAISISPMKEFERLKTQEKDDFSQIKKNSDEQSNLLQQDKEILSRVVNLDQQLKKSEVNSPQKQKKPIQPQIQQKPLSQNKQIPINFPSGPQLNLQPITQYITSPQSNKLKPHHQTMGQFPQRKPSTLVLNLIVQIQTKSISFLKKKQKFHVVHRPYGSKQRIKLGPKFQTDVITIMCPLSEELVNKMDKMPFIVEFWGAISNQFLGFFKVNLAKFKKGFTLQGRLNQIAIKSSLMPIIMHKGQIQIQSVNGQRSGQCSIYTAIGTSSQISLYLNSDRKVEKKQIEQKQNLKKGTQKKKPKGQHTDKQPQQDIQLDLKNPHILLTNLMSYIDVNSTKNIQQLAQLIKKKQVSSEQFHTFLQLVNPSKQKSNEIVHIFKNPPSFLENKQNKFIQTSILKNSFDQFKDIQQSVFKQFSKVNRMIVKRMPQKLKQDITKKSTFNVIQKQVLRQLYLSYINSVQSTLNDFEFEKQLFENYYLSFFEDYVNVKTIFSEEKLNSAYEPDATVLIDRVVQNFAQILFKNNSTIEDLDNYLKQNKKSDFNSGLWSFCKEKLAIQNDAFSLWYWVCLTGQNIKQEKTDYRKLFIQRLRTHQYRLENIISIKEKLATEQALQAQKAKFEQANRKIQKAQKQEPKPENQKNQDNSQSMTYSNIHQILNQNDASNLIKNVLNNDSIAPAAKVSDNEPQNYQNVIIQKQNINQSNNTSEIQNQDQKSQLYNEYSFCIKGLQLYLQNPFDGECQLNYLFPYDEEVIGSKKIKVFKNKHKYAISLSGQHKITIDTDIQTYLNEIPLKFQLINLSSGESSQTILLEGDLHPDEILLQNGTAQTKVIPLFADDVQNVLGKVKIEVSYESKKTQKQGLGKETVYNLFLPKSGYVNLSFDVKLEQQKIITQYDFKDEEFYVSMIIDFFNQSKTLKPHYPPIASKLFSNLNQPIQFSSSLKLTLNPAILEYIKTKSCLVTLNLIYYSKQKGNYEKKQITFATLKIPLFNLIKSQGIEGNYAFKNKYGMFVGLCQGNINYEKHQKRSFQHESQSQLNMTGLSSKAKLNNYWILLHFKEMINFEDNVESTFVKFQTILNSTKYSTPKIHISDDPLLIFNQSILVQLSQEQFFATKIIPVTVVLDQKQKFAIDVSLRPISKKLNSQNYFAQGGYFIVVDEHSEMTKMRIGARVIVFKGNSILEPFANAYGNNPNIDVLKQIDLKRDLQNYPKLLDIFKNQLKLSKKSFQQGLKQLLPTKNQKFPLEIMSSQILYKLDLTPIIAENQSQVDMIARRVDGTMKQKALTDFIDQNQFNLSNFHAQVLSQYSFEKLWNQKIDKNVDYFNLRKEIDVLVLARKIKVIDQDDNDNHDQQERKYKELRITLEKGINFHYLYNGIKPNVVIKLPQLGYESKLKTRSSQPVFNQTLREIVQKQNQLMYKSLQIQVFHISNGRNSQTQEILIGQGRLNVLSLLNLRDPRQAQQKRTKVVISSTMSSKMKATLEIDLNINMLGQHEYNENILPAENMLEDASMIQEMIKDINKEMDEKRYMFDQSSDED